MSDAACQADELSTVALLRNEEADSAAGAESHLAHEKERVKELIVMRTTDEYDAEPEGPNSVSYVLPQPMA